MTHTPGPWNYVDDYIRSPQCTSASGNAIALPLVYEGVEDMDEMRANARLIAAAPDLLAALQAVMDTIDGKIVPFNGTDHDIVESIKRSDSVRAAIAKATE